MVASKKKIAYDIGYQKENTITKTVRFGKNTEKELCEYIANLSEPFASYVKRLIKEDMNKKSE